MDVDQHERSVDVAHFQVGQLGPAQARGVEHYQQGPVEQVRRRLDQPRHFFRAQHNRQLLRLLQQRKIVEVQIAPFQGLLVQKPQRAHAQCDRSDRQLLLPQPVKLSVELSSISGIMVAFQAYHPVVNR